MTTQGSQAGGPINSRAAEPVDVGNAESIIGISGLRQSSGRISEEQFRTLGNWQARYNLYREMMNDVTVSTLLDAIMLPLKAAEFTVAAASEDSVDLELRSYIETAMFTMYRQSWRSHVSDMLDAIPFGFALSEIVLEKRPDGLLYPRNLEPRAQETLERWEFDDEGKPELFVQRDPNSGDEIEIPMEKMLHVTFRGRKSNPEGQSALRSLYWPYRYKRQFEEFEAIGIERDIGGLPVLRQVEQGAPLTAAEREDMKTYLSALRRDETGHMIIPYGWELSSYPGPNQGKTTYDIADTITRKKNEIFQRLFGQFLILGIQSTGTQALVQGDIDFFHLGLIAVQAEIMETWNEQLIPYLLWANGFDLNQIKPPQILWADPGKLNVKALLEAYAVGWNIGMFDSNDNDKSYMRTVLDLPPLSSALAAENPFTIADKAKIEAEARMMGRGTGTDPSGPEGNGNSERRSSNP